MSWHCSNSKKNIKKLKLKFHLCCSDKDKRVSSPLSSHGKTKMDGRQGETRKWKKNERTNQLCIRNFVKRSKLCRISIELYFKTRSTFDFLRSK